MAGRLYRRRWDESRGDEFDVWGCSVWYFEVDDDGWPVRQVEVYDSGPVLRYGPGHEEDQYGGLGEASLDSAGEDWSSFVITRDVFERVWDSRQVARPRDPRLSTRRDAGPQPSSMTVRSAWGAACACI